MDFLKLGQIRAAAAERAYTHSREREREFIARRSRFNDCGSIKGGGLTRISGWLAHALVHREWSDWEVEVLTGLPRGAGVWILRCY